MPTGEEYLLFPFSYHSQMMWRLFFVFLTGLYLITNKLSMSQSLIKKLRAELSYRQKRRCNLSELGGVIHQSVILVNQAKLVQLGKDGWRQMPSSSKLVRILKSFCNLPHLSMIWHLSRNVSPVLVIKTHILSICALS